MINTFVAQLSELNNGEDIPPTWKNYFINLIPKNTLKQYKGRVVA